jgi:hypothetical protein
LKHRDGKAARGVMFSIEQARVRFRTRELRRLQLSPNDELADHAPVYEWQYRGHTMSTYTIDNARQDARRLMNAALLRMATTAALSVLFALIHCVEPVHHGQGLTSPAVDATAPAMAQAAAATPADSLDQRAGADVHPRRH